MQNTRKQNRKFSGEEMKMYGKDEKKGRENLVEKNRGKMKEYYGIGCTCLKKIANEEEKILYLH